VSGRGAGAHCPAAGADERARSPAARGAPARAGAGRADASFVVLNFHGVGPPGRALDPGEEPVWLTGDEFSRAASFATSRTDVRLTFDDANASDLRVVVPYLLARRRIARFFLPAGRLGRSGFLDADGARELVAAGMIVGSHGMHHRRWTDLPDRELENEIVGAKSLLEDVLQRPVDEAACPFGAYDRRSLACLRRAGFRRVYTSDRGRARVGDWLVARNTVHGGDGPAELGAIVRADGGRLSSLARSVRLAVKRWV
jgi:peptidoglycan/xylan/chitin deacetylase (PgdA/CDA1 family)